MKRILIALCLVGLIIALPMNQDAFAGNGKAKGPAPKVEILHATDSAVVNADGVSLVVGHVISVSENAVDAHLAHGDSLIVTADLDDAVGGWFGNMTWREVAEVWELNLNGATNAAFVLP